MEVWGYEWQQRIKWPITDQDIGGRNVSADQKSSDVTYLNEGTNFYQFSYDSGKSNDKK